MRRKILHYSLVFISIFIFVFTLASCGKNNQVDINTKSGTNDITTTIEEDDEKYKIFLLAKQSGFDGTYEEWLDSIKGDFVQLRVSNADLEWKYSKDTNWTKLISLTDLVASIEPKKIELSTSATHIVWKYEGENGWHNLVELSSLVGNEGKSAYDIAKEVGFNGTVEEWINSLKGEKGDTGNGIVKTEIDENGDLIITYTDGKVVNVGKVINDNVSSYLEFYPYSDNTYGVSAGKALFLDEITIPETYNGKPVTRINPGAFRVRDNNCGVKSLIIPSSITKVGSEAFYYSPLLTKVYYYGTKEQYESILNNNIAYGNDYLLNAKWYFYTNNGATETKNGSYWYYDDEGNIKEIINEFIITYETFGGTEIANNYTNEMYVVKPNDPYKNGYLFGGWYSDIEFTKEFDFNSKIDKNITLYAKFINVNMEITTTKDKATIKLTFDENENIKSSVLYIVCYKVDNGTLIYHSRQDVDFSNSVYTSSIVEFNSLVSEQEYKFILYVTFNGTDEKIVEKTATTQSIYPIEITSVYDFKNYLTNDTNGEFKLTSNLDFGGESLGLFSSEAKAFQGKLDGGIYDADGNLTGCHKISNYALTSNSNVGLFGYLKNATIKNLIIEDVTIDFTIRSTACIGTLVGYAERTSVSNVIIKNVTYEISASSSAEHFTGGVVGKSVGSSFDNVEATNVSINYTSARIKVSVGLFAGALLGEGLENVTAKSCGAEGTLAVVAEYSLSSTSDYADYIYIGGFAGQIGSNGTINDCYSKVDATYSMKQQARKFDLFMGGFVGGNTANIRITNSLAIATLKAYAGLTPTDGDGHDYSENLVASQNAYVGGFIGNANGSIYGIRNSYSKLLAEIVAEGKAQNDDGDTVLFVDSFKAKVSDSVSVQAFDGSSTITTEKPENLSEKLKGLLE